jgi:hypothetical protein
MKAVFCDVALCDLVLVHRRFESDALMMEAASTSERSINFYQTTQGNIPEDSRSILANVRTSQDVKIIRNDLFLYQLLGL